MGFNPLDIVGKVVGLADGLFRDADEKADFKLKLGALVQERDGELEKTFRKQLEAKERVMVAEMTQGDNYTKRARPTVVYAGLIIMALNYMVLPWVAHFSGQLLPTIEIPAIFWTAWGGVVATWSIGRDVNRQKLGVLLGKA